MDLAARRGCRLRLGDVFRDVPQDRAHGEHRRDVGVGAPDAGEHRVVARAAGISRAGAAPLARADPRSGGNDDHRGGRAGAAVQGGCEDHAVFVCVRSFLAGNLKSYTHPPLRRGLYSVQHIKAMRS